MRIGLNLATRPFADAGPTLKRLRIAMLVLLLISGGAYMGLRALHNQAQAARARAHSLDGALAGVSAERQGYLQMMQQPDNARLLAETRTLNSLFDEKAFSWTLTMESLETVLPGGVQVSTLEPVRDADGHITLRMRVIGPRDKGIEFVRNLEHSQRFLFPRIVGESAQNAGGPNQNNPPVSDTNAFSFELQAEYNPPSADEMKTLAGSPAAGPARASLTGPQRKLRPTARISRPPAPTAAPGRPAYQRPAPPAHAGSAQPATQDGNRGGTQ